MHLLQHLPDDVRANGPLDCFSAFPFESYMRQTKKSVHSGYAVAKQAARRHAEKMPFCDRLQVSCLINTTPIAAKEVSNKQPDSKQHVIVDVPSKKQLMIAAKQWIVGKELCLFPTELVDIHLQNCNRPDDNWSVMKCKVINEFDTSPSTLESKHVDCASVAQ
ncbi:unnamed protein product [Schistosoma margrebowiei]|uniref:Uncharacterized protein n=1 Tax=Schistosoma margrebowiei TaxID=48269 RepID=A0A183N920_9TREM|nr:unnamed protein product [Schistosoma margrebowiei]